MSFPDLIIGGIVVPRLACLSVDQDYGNIGPVTLQRLGDGTGLIQSHGWSKLSTSIDCTGWASEGLAGIDFHDQAGVTIACIKPRSIKSPSNIITIPAARRTDEPVRGFACVGAMLVPSPVGMAGNIATITTVPGASGYQAEWLPLLTCFCEGGVRVKYSMGSNEHGWSLQGEEL